MTELDGGLLFQRLSIFVGVAAAAAVVTRSWIAFARRVKLAAPPDIWHDQPVAQAGGIAIWATIFGACFVLGLHRDPVVLRLLAAAAVTVVVGFIDDKKPLKPNTKLILQLAIVIGLLATSFTSFTRLHLAIAVPICALWLVGQSNAVNLLDNMDGACPTIVGSTALVLAVHHRATPPLAILCIIVAAAAFGFLVWNRKPARVFMGDTGSLALGMLLGGIAMWNSWVGPGASLKRILVPPLLMVVPLFNVAFVVITRRDAGVPVSRGLADHINYRFVAHGFSTSRTLVALALLAFFGGALAWTQGFWATYLWVALVGLFGLAIAYLGVFLSHADVEQVYDKLGVPRVPPTSTAYRTQRRRVFEVLADATVASAAYFLCFQLRFDGDVPANQDANITRGVPIVIMTCVLLLWGGGLYRALWKYIGMHEALRIARAAALAGAVLYALTFVGWFKMFPRSVCFLFPMLFAILATGYRLSLRVMHDWRHVDGAQAAKPERVKILIVGAGDAGELALRGLRTEASVAPCGFLDDDPDKIGMRIHGVPVLAPTNAAVALALELGVSEIVVAMPTAPQNRVAQIMDQCHQHGIRTRVVFDSVAPRAIAS